MPTELKSFTASQFIGKPVLADIEFVPLLDKINQLAIEDGLEIFVTSSARQQGTSVLGAIVAPASFSNHLIGHAIDMNIKMGSAFFNSHALSHANFRRLPSEVQAFIQAIRDHPLLCWGGDFNDPVHIDDGLNIREPAVWREKFPIIQSALIALTRPSSAPGQPRLLFLTRPLMQGEDVRIVQQKLIERGFEMNADGIFGPVTDMAVTNFQAKEELTADGIVGPATRKALGL